MPTVPSRSSLIHSDSNGDLYDPRRPDDGPTLADWASYLAWLDEAGGLFPRDEAPELPDHFDFDPVADLQPSFVPTDADLKWLSSLPRCETCERPVEAGEPLCTDCTMELEACRDEPDYDGPEGWPSWTDGVRYTVSR